MINESIANIPTSKEPSSLRIVDFKKRNKERPPTTKRIMYGKFIERIAKKMGCAEKHGRIINLHTGKISDGNLCEEAVLGKCNIKRNEMIPVPASNLNPIIRKQAENVLFKFTKNHQPKDNESKVITRVKELIQEKTGPIAENHGQEIKQVKFYTAVGSPLDYLYGIDGWIEIRTINGSTEKITFDLKSGNSKKMEYDKQADLLLKIDDHKIESMPQETLTQLFRFVDEVSDVYEDRLK